MDGRGGIGFVGGEAVRSGRSCSVELLLHADGDGERGESAVDASDRRVVSEAAILRLSADHRVASGVGLASEREASGSADGGDGITGGGTGASYKPTSPGASDLSVPVERDDDHGAGRGVVRRHNVLAYAAGFSVPGGGDGLVQPVCVGVGVVEHAGGRFLPGCIGAVAGGWETWDLQHGPGIPVHQRGFHRLPGGCWRAGEYDRARSGDGQPVCGAAVEDSEV